MVGFKAMDIQMVLPIEELLHTATQAMANNKKWVIKDIEMVEMPIEGRKEATMMVLIDNIRRL